jgi:hypothetical protein
VGMRIIRPLSAPAGGERNRFWEDDVEEVVGDTQIRLEQGRALLLPVDKDLAGDVEKAKDLSAPQ